MYKHKIPTKHGGSISTVMRERRYPIYTIEY